MAGSFDGKVALITGGNSGIGKAAAIKFAQEGAKVVVAARRVPEGEEAVGTIRRAGGEAIFVKADVSKTADVEAMVNRTIEAYGRLDYAFNNAGFLGVDILTHEYPEEAWNTVINVNLKGVWLCMKYQVPRMLEQGGGAIVNNSSVNGLVGSPGESAYTASKHGVIGLTRTAALEYAGRGIRVNAVCPGYIYTPMVEEIVDANPEDTRRILQRYPLGRLGTSEEAAEAAVWLCSDAASFITGAALPVDGGMMAH